VHRAGGRVGHAIAERRGRPAEVPGPGRRTVSLDIELRTLQAQGIADIVLSLGHESQQVLDWLATRAAAAHECRMRPTSPL
jgi:hypothetical protein